VGIFVIISMFFATIICMGVYNICKHAFASFANSDTDAGTAATKNAVLLLFVIALWLILSFYVLPFLFFAAFAYMLPVSWPTNGNPA
jgi:hypothetical protein